MPEHNRRLPPEKSIALRDGAHNRGIVFYNIFGDPRDRSLLLYAAGRSLLATAAAVALVLLLGISQTWRERSMGVKTVDYTENPWQTRLTVPPNLNYSLYTGNPPPNEKSAPLESVIFPNGRLLDRVSSDVGNERSDGKAYLGPMPRGRAALDAW